MTKSLLLRCSALVVASAGTWIAVSQAPPAQPLTVEKIADDLHVIVGSGGNVGVLTTPDGVILIDDKFAPNVPEIIAKVKGISSKPIKYVLNTHHHGDHTGGNAALMDTNVETIAHRNAVANMIKGKQPGVPHIAYQDQAAVNLGGKEVIAMHVGRGHTNGDAVMYLPAHKTVHMGDLFVVTGPFCDYSNGGSALAWSKTIDEALKLDFETAIPGHGPILKKQDLLEWRKKLDGLVSKMRELKKAGKSRDEAVAAAKPVIPGWSGGMFDRTLAGLYDEI
jgi:cyclase